MSKFSVDKGITHKRTTGDAWHSIVQVVIDSRTLDTCGVNAVLDDERELVRAWIEKHGLQECRAKAIDLATRAIDSILRYEASHD